MPRASSSKPKPVRHSEPSKQTKPARKNEPDKQTEQAEQAEQAEQSKQAEPVRGVAKKRAARTGTPAATSKARTRVRAARTAAKPSAKKSPPTKRGGPASPATVAESTYQQLYEEARRQNVKGRSTMRKADLVRALG